MVALPEPSDSPADHQPEFDDLLLFLGQPEEIGGIPDFPNRPPPRLRASGRPRLSFLSPGFVDRLVISPQTTSAVVDDTFRRLLGGLGEHRGDHDGIGIEAVLLRQERSSQTGNHGKHRRTQKGGVDSDSLFRGFRWIPWLISDPPGAAIGGCWTESAVRICAELGCRCNRRCASSTMISSRSEDATSATRAKTSLAAMETLAERRHRGEKSAGIVPNCPTAHLTLCAAKRRKFGACAGGKSWERAKLKATKLSSRHPLDRAALARCPKI